MVKVTATYQGHKHCQVVHGPSAACIETDAPKDNNGKGEAFSPTDLVAAATGSCMLTVMSIAAEKDGVRLEGSYTTVEKEMVANPRRIGKLSIQVHLRQDVDSSYREKLEQTALNCPVKKSLHPDMELQVQFFYDV